MSKTVTLTIDGNEVTVPEGTTILEAARQGGVDIPVICYHPHMTANGLCRICSVDVGWRVQAAACVTPVQEGMEVKTQSEEVRRGRRTLLEMLASTVQICGADAQYTFALSFDGRGFHTTIGTFLDAPMPDTTCVFCGQCVGVCPTGALKPKRQALLEQGLNPDEIFFQTRARRRRQPPATPVNEG
jgi:NADH dehydrogenase/NADH:ubiquinone oxidoreductase subunit G